MVIRLISISLMVFLVIGIFPVSAFATDAIKENTSPEQTFENVQDKSELGQGGDGTFDDSETNDNNQDLATGSGSSGNGSADTEGTGNSDGLLSGDTFDDGNAAADSEDKNESAMLYNFNQYALEESEDAAVISDEGLPSVHYEAHVSNIGWQDSVSDGALAGTTGKSFSLEALSITLQHVEGSIEYRAHVSNIGWQDGYAADGAISGTTGQGLSIEAFRIQLTGEAANLYDVYYRVHSSNIGWLDWAKNNEPAGTAGFSYAIEAIEIRLVEKGGESLNQGGVSFKEKMISYQAHVSNIGWQSSVADGAIAGTTGRALSVESLTVLNTSNQIAGSIVSQGNVQYSGWQPEVLNGTIGTTGQSKFLQAVRFAPEGELAENFDLYYRVHVRNIGWMDWAKNGENAGTVGYNYPIEAVQIELVAKDGAPPGSTDEAFRSREFSYQTHVSGIGWMSPVASGEISGTTGQSRSIESFCASLEGFPYEGSISYRSHVSNIGWQGYVSNGAMSGTTGRGLPIEALCIKLEGEIANYFEVYYRVHVSNVGWLDWASNNIMAGSTGYGLKVEAVQVMILEKSETPPDPTDNPSLQLTYSYDANVLGSGWQEPVGPGQASGTTGYGTPIQQLSMTTAESSFAGGIQYSTHVANVGWQDYVADGEAAGVPGNNIEALRVRLTGTLSQCFDVYYRVHVQNIGWMGWAKNGARAGTSSLGYAVEAYQVVIVRKGANAPGSTSVPFKSVATMGNRIAVLDTLPGGFNVFGGPNGLSQNRINELYNAIHLYEGRGIPVGFLMIDLNTGEGVSYGIDRQFYSASTIKGPYVAAVAKYSPWALGSHGNTMFDTIYTSSNIAYANLRNSVGTDPLVHLINDTHAWGFYWPSHYVNYSTRDLSKLWIGVADYMMSDQLYADWCRNVFGSNFAITSRPTLSWKGCPIYAKSGWINGASGNVHNEACIVMDANSPYLMVVMTEDDHANSWYMANLMTALDRAHSEMIQY